LSGSYFAWEDHRFRFALPDDLASILGLASGPVVVPIDVVKKIDETHPFDAPYLDQIGRFLTNWQFAGGPPDRPGRFEVFGSLEGAWRTAVLGTHRAPATVHLITFHRVDVQRITSKRRRGYLVGRGS